MEDLGCNKCLSGWTGDIVGAPCKTPGCDGVIEKRPEFKDVVDELPEVMWCPRRGESGLGSRLYPEGDHWQKFKSNGNRVCSYCGSLHPEDMFALVKACAEAPQDAPYRSVVEIEPSDKNYKVYVHQPGVRNAGEGGIKFYMMHLPRNADGRGIAVTAAKEAEYAKAVHATRKRFGLYLAGMHQRKAEHTSPS